MLEVKGIDVSHHQGDIDFAKVKASEIRFTTLRAGYGRENLRKQIDQKFYQNYRMAVKEDLPCSFYRYSDAINPQEAEQEADSLLKIIERCEFAYPVAFDREDKSQMNLGRKASTDISYKDYPAIIKSHGLNGYTKAAPVQKNYTVVPGDTMSGVAEKYRISVQALIKANPQVKSPNFIPPGTVPVIPD